MYTDCNVDLRRIRLELSGQKEDIRDVQPVFITHNLLVQDGHLVRTLKGHAHWVNTLALSSEHALRTGAFDHTGTAPTDPAEAKKTALDRCASLSHSLLQQRSSKQDSQTYASSLAGTEKPHPTRQSVLHPALMILRCFCGSLAKVISPYSA